ncbi:MAG: cupin domain-containing protein [Planctomycetota bacterium]|nr:cupin domain-containing protein [Planctomycetota bacterium]
MDALRATPAALATLIDYAAGGIVSKVLLKQPAGSVTLFAFDAGQELSEHTAPFDALVYLVEGSAVVTISGKANRLGPGETVLMPANEPHALKALQPFKMLLIMIRGPGN